MTADAIARVIEHFKLGRVDTSGATERLLAAGYESNLYHKQVETVGTATVVDVTALFERIIERDEARALYESHVLAPPFDNASFCWVNSHGNVHVANVKSVTNAEYPVSDRWVSDAPTHALDWDAVAWVLSVTLWVGGYSNTTHRHIPTTGPVYAWLVAVDPDGVPLDIRWVEVTEFEPTNAQLVWLAAIDFLNCRNVEMTEPVRPRHQRRRLERHGVRVHELTVFPTGRTTRSPKGDPVGVALTSVRGHFATYGTDGRGLLFGKYAGRYWIPQHARGSAEHGTIDKTYRVEP